MPHEPKQEEPALAAGEKRPLHERSSVPVSTQHERSSSEQHQPNGATPDTLREQELLVKAEPAPLAAPNNAQPQIPSYIHTTWEHEERDYESRPGKRRKLLPSPSHLTGHFTIKAEPVGDVKAPPGDHEMECNHQFKPLGESPFASTEEMLDQMYNSEVAILRRLAETSVAVAHQVKELVDQEARVARVEEMVANALRVLEFAAKMGSSVSFGREFNAVLVEMEQSVAHTIDVLEECESGSQRAEGVVTLLQEVKNLDEHYNGMSTVFAWVHHRLQALLLSENGEQPVDFEKPTHQWTALSGLCAHVVDRYSNALPAKQYSHMVQLVRVLKTMFSIILDDTSAVARFFSPEEYTRIQSAVEFVVASILSRPIPAEYLHMFRQLSLEMHGAGSRLRKLSVLVEAHETRLAAYLQSEEARLDARRDLLSDATEPVTPKEHASVCTEYLRYIHILASDCTNQATALTNLEAKSRTAKQLEKLVDTVLVTLYTVQAMNSDWDDLLPRGKIIKEIDNSVNETIKLVLDTVLPSTEKRALEVLNTLSNVVGGICHAIPQLKVSFFRTNARLLNICCGWNALSNSREANPSLAESLGRSVAAARKCLEFAQALDKAPSSQRFSTTTSRLNTAFKRWQVPEKIAENEDSLRLLANAVEIAVRFACEQRIPDLTLERCKKLDMCLSFGRELFKDAEEYLAEPHAKLQKFIQSEKKVVQQTPTAVLPPAKTESITSEKQSGQQKPKTIPPASTKKFENIQLRLAAAIHELKAKKNRSISLGHFDTVVQLLNDAVVLSYPGWNPKSDPKVAQCADELEFFVHDISLDGVIRQRRDRLGAIKKSLLRPSARAQTSETRSTKSGNESVETSERLHRSADRIEDLNRAAIRSSNTQQPAGLQRTIARSDNSEATRNLDRPISNLPASRHTKKPEGEIEEGECVDDQEEGGHEAMVHSNQEEATSLFDMRDLEFQVRKAVATADEVFSLEVHERVSRFDELVKSIKTALEIIRELGPNQIIHADWLTQIEWCIDTAVLIGDAEREHRPAMKSMVASTLLPDLSRLDSEYPNLESAFSRIRQQLQELQISGKLHIPNPKDSVFRTWQLLTNACLSVAQQVENTSVTSEKQGHAEDLLNLLESTFTRISESSAAQGKRMRPEHMQSVKKALGVVVKAIVEGEEVLSLSEERQRSYTTFCEKVALARARDTILEISLFRSYNALKTFLASILPQ